QKLTLVGNPRSGDKAIERLQNVAAELFQQLVVEADAGREYAEGTIGGWLLRQSGRPAADADDEAYLAWTKQLLEQADCPVQLTIDVNESLKDAQAVVIATSSAEEFITPEMLRHGAVVCDMSRPPNVSRRVEKERPDVLVLDGGVIEV